MDQPYMIDSHQRVQSNNLNVTQGQVYKQNFYYTSDDVNKIASLVGDKRAHQVEKPIRYGYLESSILNKALPAGLLQREIICVRKNINFHKLMYTHMQYLALVNIREVKEESGLVSLNLAIIENDSDKLVASGEAILLFNDKSSEEKPMLKKGLRLTSR
jgi:hypothetical protein